MTDPRRGPAWDKAQLTGVTYRQFDYWSTCGYIHTEQTRRMSGCYRAISDGELEVLSHMVRLTKAGVRASAAATIARQLVTYGRSRIGSYVIINDQGDQK